MRSITRGRVVSAVQHLSRGTEFETPLGRGQENYTTSRSRAHTLPTGCGQRGCFIGISSAGRRAGRVLARPAQLCGSCSHSPNRLWAAGLLYRNLVSGEERGQSPRETGAAVRLTLAPHLSAGHRASAHGLPSPS